MAMSNLRSKQDLCDCDTLNCPRLHIGVYLGADRLLITPVHLPSTKRSLCVVSPQSCASCTSGAEDRSFGAGRSERIVGGRYLLVVLVPYGYDMHGAFRSDVRWSRYGENTKALLGLLHSQGSHHVSPLLPPVPRWVNAECELTPHLTVSKPQSPQAVALLRLSLEACRAAYTNHLLQVT